jgi:glycosyltransferase involved in cell wall biosynthesis
MHIALLTAEYPPRPGGVGDYTRRLGEALVARGHNISVLTIFDFRLQILDLGPPETIPKSKIQNPKSDWGWGSWPVVIAALDELRPDILHIQYQTGAYGMHPAINLLPWRLRRLPGRPSVAVTAHDLLPPYLFPKAGPLRGWVTRRLLADADAVVLTNETDFAEVMKLGMSDRRLEVARQSLISNPQSPALIPIGSNIPVAPPPGYARAAWRGRLGLTTDDILIAYFGLISRSKGLDVLLDALARLPERFRLLVIGGAATLPEDRAYAAEIERQLDERRLRERVISTGHCAEAEVSAHLLAADMAALPFADGASFRRGSLLATLAHGVPMVTTTDEDIQSVSSLRPSSFVLRPLVDGENVLLVPPGDAGALAAALERLADDAALRERLGTGGRALATQFSWESIAEQHETLYRDLIAAARPSTSARH